MDRLPFTPMRLPYSISRSDTKWVIVKEALSKFIGGRLRRWPVRLIIDLGFYPFCNRRLARYG